MFLGRLFLSRDAVPMLPQSLDQPGQPRTLIVQQYAQEGRPTQFTLGTNGSLYLLYTHPLTFDEAQLACERLGGSLPSVNDLSTFSQLLNSW